MPELSRPKLRGSFTEHNLDAEPHRPDEACHDNCDRGLERKTLSLFDTLAPTPQVLKVGSHFSDGLSHFANHAQADRRMEDIHTAPCRRDPWSSPRAVALSETPPAADAWALACD